MYQFLLLIFLGISSTFGCPSGQIHDTNSNFCYQSFSSPVSWFSADYQCQKIGGRLATIDNTFLNQILYGSGKTSFGNNGSFWFGSTTMFVSGQWLWADGSNSTFTNWAPNQPVSNTGSYCSSMHLSDGKWYSEDCQTTKSYFCEIPQNSPSNVTYPSTTCPPLPNFTDGTQGAWEYSNSTGKCYLKIAKPNGIYPTLTESQAQCQQYGADGLVVINSAIENSIVGSFMSLFSCGTIWGCLNSASIGLYNNGSGWVWIDGTPLTYSHWLGSNTSTVGRGMLVYGNYNNWWINDLNGGSAVFTCQKVMD